MPAGRAEVVVCSVIALCACLAACSDPPASRVVYTSGEPLGDWYERDHAEPESAAAQGGGHGGDTAQPPISGTSGLTGGTAQAGAAGANTPVGVSGRPSTNSAGGAAAAAAATAGRGGMTAAGSGGVRPPPTAAGGVRVRFTALTQVQHMGAATFDLDICGPSKAAPAPAGEAQYARGPCNVGAIWITTDTGVFVTVLALWAKLEVDNLVEYNTQYAAVRKAQPQVRSFIACHVQKGTGQDCPEEPVAEQSDAPPDVTATATLHAHQRHTVTWDHTDWQQQPVEPGRYQLHVEVSDYDMKDATARALTQNPHNAALTIELDTAACPATIAAPTAAYFDMVSVECQRK